MRCQLPRRIKIGAHVYSVVRPVAPKHNGEALDGLCESSELRFTVRKGLKRSMTQETVVHEFLHACADGADIPDKHEERMILTIAPRLLQLIRDNPELIFYLQS